MNGVSLLPPSQTITSACVLGEVEDLRVVDAGEDDVAGCDVRLVLLALLDRALGGLEILVALEALRYLLREVAVRHRMA